MDFLKVYGQEKWEETKILQGQGKARDFYKKSGKIFDIVKFREFYFPCEKLRDKVYKVYHEEHSAKSSVCPFDTLLSVISF